MLKGHVNNEEDMIWDQTDWFEPIADCFQDFAEKVMVWISEAQLCILEAAKCNEEVQPSDSVSSAYHSSCGSKAGSVCSSSASSSVLVDRDTLLVQASALKQRQILGKK